MTKWYLLAPLVVLAASCLPATQTIVELTATGALAVQHGVLVVRVTSEDGEEIEHFRLDVDETWSWPAVIPLSPRGGDASRRFRFSATFSNDDGNIVVRAALGFAAGTQFRVALRFDESCRGQTCGAGFSCEDGTCVSIFRDSECGLPGGVGCDAQTGCGCPDDHVCLNVETAPRASTFGPTCLPRVERSICTGASDCAAGESCSQNGECRAADDTVCEPTQVGSATFGMGCSESSFCGPGLVCVRSSSTPDDDQNFSFRTRARCRFACNPCQSDSTCQGRNECITVPGGGGFCSRDGVALETETCDSTRFCGNGFYCFSGRCVRSCRGHLPGTSGCAVRSQDCNTGEVCVRAGGAQYCAPGSDGFPGPEGGICNPSSECPCPLACLASSDSAFMCARANTLCSECAAEGKLCLTRSYLGVTAVACIVPGSLRDFDECDVNEHCQSGFCNTDDGICRSVP